MNLLELEGQASLELSKAISQPLCEFSSLKSKSSIVYPLWVCYEYIS